jgi:predicted ATP-dependent protease
VQSIGGVNEKIEGFYQLCKDKGLTGGQGVIIPKTNVINLMLGDDVISAVEQGDFSIYAVEDIDQAIEILMSLNAGNINSTGRYPRKSIHGMVLNKLANLADLLAGEEE